MWESLMPFFFFFLGFVVSNVWHWVQLRQLRRLGRRLVAGGLTGTANDLGLLGDTNPTEEELEEDRQVAKLQHVLASGEKPDGVP